MTFTMFGTAHLGQARCICSSNPEGCPLHQRAMPIDAPDRSVCALTGEIADGLSFPALLPNAAEIAKLTAERDEALADVEKLRHEIDDLTDLLKASGAHIACLSTNVAMYQTERDEYRERGDEWRDKAEMYLATIDELQAEIRELRGEQ